MCPPCLLLPSGGSSVLFTTIEHRFNHKPLLFTSSIKKINAEKSVLLPGVIVLDMSECQPETNLWIPVLAELTFLLLLTFHIQFSSRLPLTENCDLHFNYLERTRETVWWPMPVVQHLGGKHETINADSRSARGLHQGPGFKKGNQTNITINNNKARGDKQASVQCHVQFGSNSLPQVSKRGRLK